MEVNGRKFLKNSWGRVARHYVLSLRMEYEIV